MSDPYGQNPYGGQPATPGQQPASYGQPAPYGQPGPYGQPAYAPYPQRDPDRRPGTVTAAAVVGIVGSALTFLGAAFFAVAAAVAREDFAEGFEEGSGTDLGTSADNVVTAVVVICGVLAVWSLVAVVLSVLVLRRSQVARILLVVSAGVATLVSLLAAPLGLLFTVLTVLTIVLLFVGGANEWFSRKGGTEAGPSGYTHTAY